MELHADKARMPAIVTARAPVVIRRCISETSQFLLLDVTVERSGRDLTENLARISLVRVGSAGKVARAWRPVAQI